MHDPSASRSSELKPLLGLLFDDVSITFDDKTLLPQAIMRNGLEEDVESLSGGTTALKRCLTRAIATLWHPPISASPANVALRSTARIAADIGEIERWPCEPSERLYHALLC